MCGECGIGMFGVPPWEDPEEEEPTANEVKRGRDVIVGNYDEICYTLSYSYCRINKR